MPSALTAEMENEKKMKLAEKRKQKRKAANERNKVLHFLLFILAIFLNLE